MRLCHKLSTLFKGQMGTCHLRHLLQVATLSSSSCWIVGVFDVVPTSETKGYRVYGSRFVEEIGILVYQPAFELWPSVIQGSADKSHALLTCSLAVSLYHSEYCFALTKYLLIWRYSGGHFCQAYMQSWTKLARQVLIWPPSDLGIPPDHVLCFIHRLYGLAKSGVHWFTTYHKHHANRKNLNPSVHDWCFLFTIDSLSVLNSKLLDTATPIGLPY